MLRARGDRYAFIFVIYLAVQSLRKTSPAASSSPPGGDGAGNEIQAADAAAPEEVTSPAPVEL